MKIALTQRSDFLPRVDEYRDSLDQNWFNLFSDDICFPIPNLQKSFERWCDGLNLDLIVLTGGNDIQYSKSSQNVCLKRDALERQILEYSKRRRIPVLGVCRGLQMMNVYEGGEISYDPEMKIELHKVTIRDENHAQPFVNSFHKWFIPAEKMPKVFDVKATDMFGNIEAIRHRYFPWLGVMWHPERNKETESLHLVNEFLSELKCR